MADNIAITAGTGTTVAADEVSDGTLGSCKVQFVKLMDGTLGGTDKALVDSAGLKVNLGADNDVTVTSGSITANAGTNLNTSLLALEAGGNLAAAAASLSVLDDWDETNRAAVNTIAGQVGVQGASGVVTALTQRMVLATDVALPAGTNAIGKLAANSGVDIGDVDVTSSALPTGASTLAEQQTQTASLSVLDDWDETDRAKVNIIVGQAGVAAGTGADSATTQRISLATDIPLPAGTNAIGKLAANSGVDIGDVDVTTCGTITPGTAATNLGKAVDSAVGSTDTGVAMLAVRRNSGVTLTPANGDYARPGLNATGELVISAAKPTIASSNGTAITTTTTTTLIAAPSAGNHLRIKYIQASNSGSTAVKVGWRDGAAGALTYETHLPQNGIFAHTIEGGWDLTTATLFALNTNANGNVYWTVEYESLAD